MTYSCSTSCSYCRRDFQFKGINNNFNQSAHAYCNKCGMACVLVYNSRKIPPKCKFFEKNENIFRIIDQEVEPYLKYCPCGGEFKHNALPRCPNCTKELEEFRKPKYKHSTVIATKEYVRDWWKGDWSGDEHFPKESFMLKGKRFLKLN